VGLCARVRPARVLWCRRILTINQSTIKIRTKRHTHEHKRSHTSQQHHTTRAAQNPRREATQFWGAKGESRKRKLTRLAQCSVFTRFFTARSARKLPRKTTSGESSSYKKEEERGKRPGPVISPIIYYTQSLSRNSVCAIRTTAITLLCDLCRVCPPPPLWWCWQCWDVASPRPVCVCGFVRTFDCD